MHLTGKPPLILSITGYLFKDKTSDIKKPSESHLDGLREPSICGVSPDPLILKSLRARESYPLKLYPTIFVIPT
ncbi:hypothetical protein J2Y02_005191 [Neobacillus drentensis]|nr:hypothetical protein [Neobacillus drentensis]